MSDTGLRRGSGSLARGATVAAALGAAVWLVAAPARAQNDRPDLLDYRMAIADVADPNNTAYLYCSHSVSSETGAQRIGVRGRIRKVVTGSTVSGSTFSSNVAIYWYMYEPDKISRKSTGAKLKQGNFVAFIVDGSTSAVGSFHGEAPTGGIDGCKGQIKVKGSSTLTGKWKVHCQTNVLDSLGLTAEQKNAVKTFLGTDTITEISGSR